MGFYDTNGISKTRHCIDILSSFRENMDVHWIILYTNFNVQQLYQWKISYFKDWFVEKNILDKNILSIKTSNFSNIQKLVNSKLKYSVDAILVHQTYKKPGFYKLLC